MHIKTFWYLCPFALELETVVYLWCVVGKCFLLYFWFSSFSVGEGKLKDWDIFPVKYEMRGQQYLNFASFPLIGAKMTKQIERFLPPSVLERARESRRLKGIICKFNTEWNLHFSLRGVGSSSDTNILEMDFPNLQWAACLNSTADFCPKIAALQLSLKIHGATWDQSK